MRVLVNKVKQANAVQHQHLRVFARHGGGRSGAAIEKRELADHVTLLVFRQHDLLAFRALDKELDPAVAQDKNFTAGIAVVKDGFSLLEIAAAHHFSQGFALFVIQKSEDGNFSNHGYSC